LLNRRDLFWRARILFGRGSGRRETKLLLAVQQPRTLGHEAMLARNPFLDFLSQIGSWFGFADGILFATQPNEMIKETLDWLDRYLGPVK